MANGEIRVVFTPANGADELYVSQANEATLTFTNLTGGTIDAAPGTLLFDVSFAELFETAEEQASMAIVPSGSTSPSQWNVRFASSMFPSWVFEPAESVPWPDGADLTFAVSALTPTVTPGEYYIGVLIVIGEEDWGTSLPVSVASPSDGPGDLRDTMHFLVEDDVVYGTKTSAQVIDNTLVVTFLNSRNEPIVPADVPWGTTPPSFTIAFPYASDWPGEFALTTPGLAAQFEVATSDASWSVAVEQRAGGPVWILTPETHAILGPAAGVSFTFTNVVTQLMAGPTQMFVQWSAVPEYQDGSSSVPLFKEYRPVSIRQFDINQNVFPGTDAPQSGYLTWEVDDAVLVQLSGTGQVSRAEFQYAVPVEQGGTFVLTALDPVTGTIATRCRAVTVEPSALSRAVPPGTILMWSGDANDVPDGFVACDGRTAGVPDLSGRFIRGAGKDVQPLQPGEATHTHPYGTLTARTTVEDGGEHVHPLPQKWYSRYFDSGGSRTAIDTNGTYVDDFTRPDGNHGHTVPTSTRAGGTTSVQSADLRPRWYALLYIMKKWE